jgi:ketosteroid isomerase-like protein
VNGKAPTLLDRLGSPAQAAEDSSRLRIADGAETCKDLLLWKPGLIRFGDPKMGRIHRYFSLATVMILGATLAFPAQRAIGEELPPNIVAASDPGTSADQRLVYMLIHQYEQLLNAGNTEALVDLFATDAVIEWNDAPTFTTRQQKVDGYNALFGIAKISTAFVYDVIDVYGNVAIVRTHHLVGATVIVNGKTVLDYNREVFVLRKQADGWKIIVYTFNTNPIQGQG